MRPGQLTPENRAELSAKLHTNLASMRPGQLTPENAVATVISSSPGSLQ